MGHRGAQLLALLRPQAAMGRPPSTSWGQVGARSASSSASSCSAAGDGGRVHRLDQAIPTASATRRIAVPLGLDQIPRQETRIQRQRFEDVGDVGRVQAVELVGQPVLLRLADQAFHQIMLGHVLPVDLPPALAGKQVLDLAQAGCRGRRGAGDRRFRPWCRSCGRRGAEGAGRGFGWVWLRRGTAFFKDRRWLAVTARRARPEYHALGDEVVCAAGSRSRANRPAP